MPSQTLLALGRLSPGGWRRLCEIAAAWLVVETALRILPFKRLLGVVTRERLRIHQDPALDELLRLTQAVFRRSPFKAACLTQSLVLLLLLRRRGIMADLKLGVRTAGGRFHAHAWLEQDGRSILEDAGAAQFQGAFSLAQSE